MHFSTGSYRVALPAFAVVGTVLLLGDPADASTARRLGQPISAYSASLFGKTNLTALQTQTLTADPDEPLVGSTSGTFNPAIVRVTDYGYGPGYEIPIQPPIGLQAVVAPALASPFISGFGIEVLFPASPNGAALIDINEYLEIPNSFTPTGYYRVWFAVGEGGVAATGKLTSDPTFLANHADYIPLGNDGPLGVDTHYLDFIYKEDDNTTAAAYRVFAEDADKHYAFTPFGNSQFTLLNSDFVVPADSPEEVIRPGGDVPFQDANVAGTVPEPSFLGAIALGGLLGVRRRRQTRPSRNGLRFAKG
jgi:MYXO-CTERM domain-containing protein